MLLIGATYLTAACTLAVFVEQGWPQWLYLVFFLFLINAAKFGIHGIGRTLLGLIRLPARLIRRAHARRAAKRDTPQEQEAVREFAAV